PGPAETYQEIATALDFVNEYLVKTTWHHPISAADKKKYSESLEVLKSAIEFAVTQTDTHPFIHALTEKKLTPLQVKTTLLLMYFAGSETAASLLNYVLWQLGQHPEYQEIIYKEIQQSNEKSLYDLAMSLKSVKCLLKECTRLFTPGYILGRQAG